MRQREVYSAVSRKVSLRVQLSVGIPWPVESLDLSLQLGRVNSIRFSRENLAWAAIGITSSVR